MPGEGYLLGRISFHGAGPSEIVTDCTPVEHPEGTRFNGVGGVNIIPSLKG